MKNGIPGYDENKNSKRLDTVKAIVRNRDHRVLMDPNSSQDEKLEALENIDANRRLKTARSQALKYSQNGFYNELPGPDQLPSFETDMSTRVSNYNGHQVASSSYQKFTDATIQTDPMVYARTANVSNFGYASELGDRARKLAHVTSVTQYLQQQMDPAGRTFVANVSRALKDQAGNGQQLVKAFERFEHSNNTHKQEHLYLIASNLNIIKESYDDTAGKWVVVMPWASPQSADQILYNQKGLSNVNYKELEQQQIGNYWVNAEQNAQRRAQQQLPPAQENGAGSGVPYSAKNPKSQRSLQNPRRGDDYIRAARLKTESIDKLRATQNSLMEDLKVARQSWIIEKLQKQIKGVKNAIESERGQLKIMNDKQNEKERYAASTKQLADGLNELNRKKTSKDETRAEGVAYQRHLSLLSEAKNLLSQDTTFLGIPRSNG